MSCSIAVEGALPAVDADLRGGVGADDGDHANRKQPEPAPAGEPASAPQQRHELSDDAVAPQERSGSGRRPHRRRLFCNVDMPRPECIVWRRWPGRRWAAPPREASVEGSPPPLRMRPDLPTAREGRNLADPSAMDARFSPPSLQLGCHSSRALLVGRARSVGAGSSISWHRPTSEAGVLPSDGPAEEGAAQLKELGPEGGDHGERAVRPGTDPDGRLLARRQLSFGRPDLPLRQPAAQEAARKRAHQAAAARPLGHHAGAELHLRSPEPADQEARPRHDLHHRARAWRARPGRERFPRRHLQRSLSERLRGRVGHEAPLHPVLVSGRDSQPRGARDAGLDPRGRRARLRALARVWRRVRQPRSDRRLRGRRRRGGDRGPGDQLALEQVPEPGDRRRRPADPAPQRLQDRQSHRAGPDQP